MSFFKLINRAGKKLIKKSLAFNHFSYRVQPRIITLVLMLHLFLLFFLTKPQIPKSQTKKAISVQTVKLNPKKIEEKKKQKTILPKEPSAFPQKVKKKPRIVKKDPPQKIENAESKKIVKNTPEKKYPTVATPAKKLAVPDILLEELETLTSSLEEKIPQKIAPPLPNLKKLNLKAEIASKQIEDNNNFNERLILELQECLKLPEQGEVKASFEIDSFGNVANLIILSHKSPKNMEYIKNELPKLCFSWLNGLPKNKKSFIINFKNESR